MPQGLKNILNALSDTRTRGIIIIILFVILVTFGMGYLYFRRGVTPGVEGEARIQMAPEAIRAVPGVGVPPREYIKLQEQQDILLAQEALRRERAAIPTITRPTYVAAGVAPEEEDKCSADQLRRARRAGVSAFELRCRGCNLAALKAAGYTAGELRDAGFGAKDLKAGGFSASESKRAGFGAKQSVQAGFDPAELKQAGFTDGELAAAGLSIPKKPESKVCSPEALKKAHAQGVSAVELKRQGCSAAALKAAGYTAKQLKDAGFSAKELRDAGFSAKELKDAGFSAKELKDAGFSAGELKAAGFSAKDLKDAGFSAKDLRDAGFSADELKAAGFSAKDLKDAGFTDGDLIRAGFKPEKISVPITPIPKPTVPTAPPAVEPKPTPAVSLPPTEPISDWQKQLQLLREQQARQLSAQEYQDKVRQIQQAMSTQAGDLFAAWTPPPTQQYVEGAKEKEAEATAAGAAPAAGEQAAIPTDTYKAGTIMFATLDTGVNSDEKSPIMATVVQGALKGAKVLGNFQRINKKVVLQFYLLNVPKLKKSIPINAVAIDPNTARTALASHVNNHYLLRYGTLFAANFLSGFGQAIQDSANNVQINTSTGETFNFTENVSAGKAALMALGQVGSALSQAVQPIFNKPPTIEVKPGSGIGLLVMADLAVPKTINN